METKSVFEMVVLCMFSTLFEWWHVRLFLTDVGSLEQRGTNRCDRVTPRAPQTLHKLSLRTHFKLQLRALNMRRVTFPPSRTHHDASDLPNIVRKEHAETSTNQSMSEHTDCVTPKEVFEWPVEQPSECQAKLVKHKRRIKSAKLRRSLPTSNPPPSNKRLRRWTPYSVTNSLTEPCVDKLLSQQVSYTSLPQQAAEKPATKEEDNMPLRQDAIDAPPENSAVDPNGSELQDVRDVAALPNVLNMQLIGQGGNGSVYTFEHRQTGETLAMKLMQIKDTNGKVLFGMEHVFLCDDDVGYKTEDCPWVTQVYVFPKLLLHII